MRLTELDKMSRGHASGYSVTFHGDRWTWTAFVNGNVRRGSAEDKPGAEIAARNAWDDLADIALRHVAADVAREAGFDAR